MAVDEHPTDELARLRRIAYARGGTADDLRRLADFEAAHPSAVVAPDRQRVTTIEAPPEPGSPISAGHEAPEPLAARASRRPLLVAGLAAIAGVAVGAGVTSAILLPGREPTVVELPGVGAPPIVTESTGLAVFDREPTERDDPANLLVPLEHILPGSMADAELRWLSDVPGGTLFAARGTFHYVANVCLIVQQVDTAGASCASEEDFAERGIRLSHFGLDVRWGPQAEISVVREPE